MFLTVSMASIPCISRQPNTAMTDPTKSTAVVPTPANTPPLQHFNIRVRQRLHRYRSIKRQWNEVASTSQFDSSKTDSTASVAETTSTAHEKLIKDYITATSLKEKDSLGVDPLHSQIEKDLIELRTLIKSGQKKRTEKHASKGNNAHHRPSGENVSFQSSIDDQEKSRARKRTLDQVKISGSQMRPSTFPESPPPLVDLCQSSNNWSHPPRYYIFNNHRGRRNQPSLPLNSLIQGMPPPQKRITTPPKMPVYSPIKPITSYRLPLPPMIKKKEPTFIKQETNLPPISQPSTTTESTTTCRYNYAASTSTASPHSMKLTRQSSLLPILVHSSPCVGVPSRRTHSGRSRENNELVDYKNLIHHLPPPMISINDRGDHRILREQLDHIRETMPTCNVYESYTRNY